MTKYTVTLLLILTFTSCEKILFEKEPSEDYLDIFDAMWQDINDHYIFFDLKEIDWKAVGTYHRNRIDTAMSEEDYFGVITGALSELKDGHVSLYAGFNNWFYYDLFLNYPSNFNLSFIERNYLNKVNSIGPFIYDTITPDIGYMYYKSFGDDFTYEELDYLLNTYFTDTKGLIIDVRDNMGGAADNVTQLMSLFITDDFDAGKMMTPDIDGELIEEDIQVKKNNDLDPYTKNIVILTNRSCYSACNIFVGFMSLLNNVTIIGDTTGGGSGLAVASELANGWQYRYSAGKIILADYTELENGVAPDIFVTTGPEDEIKGVDAIIEKAINMIEANN